MNRPVPDSRTGRRRARTRKALIDATRVLVARKGVEGTTVAAITEEADVGVGTFYNHFESKEAVIAALVAETAHSVSQRLENLGRDAGDPADALAVAVLGFFGWVEEDLDRARVVLMTSLTHRSLRFSLGAMLARLILRGQQSGRFAPDDVVLTAVTVGGAILNVVLGRLEGLLGGGVPARLVAVQALRLLGIPAGEAAAAADRAQRQLAVRSQVSPQ